MNTAEKAAEVEVTEEQMENGLPRPCGYMLLIALPEVKDTYASGIAKSEKERAREEVSTVVGRVIDMGPDAYMGLDARGNPRFPSGPWCQIGDYVIFRAYSGTRFKLFGQELRLLNDDSVEGVVADPSGYSRI